MKRFTPLLVLLCLFIALTTFVSGASAAPDDPTIVGGDPVPDPNPYVWQVSLQEAGSHICGGSVIDGQWILTAAHCVVQELPGDKIADLCSPENLAYLRENFQVVIGVNALSEIAPDNRFDVVRCIHHEGYSDVRLGHDIAVIELAHPLPDAQAYIIPLLTEELAHDLEVANTSATVTGWGLTVPNNGQTRPDRLHFVEVPLVTNATCKAVYDTFQDGWAIQPGMVCAGLPEGGKDSCQGDSGGPMVIPDGVGGYFQNGIVSGGVSCALPGVPGIYTRVATYIDWLEQRTGVDFSTLRAPDLVVESLEVLDHQLTITIVNQGTARVALDNGFWVDFYINPKTEPTRVNQTWEFVGDFGAVWGVDEPGFVLLPGYAVTLTLADSFYWPTLSNLPLTQIGDQQVFVITPETKFYIQVDSANADTDYGAILETHELFAESYNNITGPLTFDKEILIPIASASNLPYQLYLPLVVDNAQNAQVTGAAAPTPTLLPERLQPLGE